jgi:hypothetical protein
LLKRNIDNKRNKNYFTHNLSRPSNGKKYTKIIFVKQLLAIKYVYG